MRADDLRRRAVDQVPTVDAMGVAEVELVDRVALGARSGDVILVMSNGAFGGFISSLIDALAAGVRGSGSQGVRGHILVDRE